MNAPPGPLPSHVTLTRFALPVAAVLAAHAGLRLLYAGSVEPDDADLILFHQRLSWGYSDQSPLYPWLCELAFHVFGVGVPALIAVRVLVLGALAVVLDATARLVCPDRRLALLAGFSVLLIPSLAWHALAYLTHTNLLMVVCVATLYTFLRLARDGRTIDYAAFGAACGVGVVTKYNFVWFAAALVAAGLTVSEARRRVFDVRTLLAAAVCTAIMLPHVLWLCEHWATIREILQVKTNRPELANAGYVARIGRGLWDSGMSSLLIAVPLVVVVKLLFPKTADRAPDAGRDLFRVLLARFFLATVVVILLQVFALGAGRFHERWLQPFAVAFPLWLFSRLDPTAVRPLSVKVYVGLLVFFATGYTVARAVQVGWFVDKPRGHYPMRLDFTPLADAIRAEAGDSPAVLTPEREIGGNLLLRLPGATVDCTCHPAYPIQLPPGPVVVAWNPAAYTKEPLWTPPWLLLDKKNERWAEWPVVPPEKVRVVEVAPGYQGGPPTRVAFAVVRPPDR